MTGAPSLRTARALLRPFTPSDAADAHRVFGDAEVMRFAAGAADADVDATRRRLARYAALQAERGFSKWGAWCLESRSYLGDAGLTVLAETGEIELGYRLSRERWGQGLATELAAAWLGYALGALGLARIVAFADPRNQASVRVMAKVGMTFARTDHLAGMHCVVYEARREEVHRGDG